MGISTAFPGYIVRQTFGLEWLAVGGNAVEGLDKQALREEEGAYKITQAICHDLVSVSVGYEIQHVILEAYTTPWKTMITNWITTNTLRR
jgi:hypothetical protein